MTDNQVEKVKEMATKYANKKSYILNPDNEILDLVIAGLAKNKVEFGRQYCPCRIITGNFDEDKKIICPCIYHEEEIKIDGHCHCALFFKKQENETCLH